MCLSVPGAGEGWLHPRQGEGHRGSGLGLCEGWLGRFGWPRVREPSPAGLLGGLRWVHCPPRVLGRAGAAWELSPAPAAGENCTALAPDAFSFAVSFCPRLLRCFLLFSLSSRSRPPRGSAAVPSSPAGARFLREAAGLRAKVFPKGRGVADLPVFMLGASCSRCRGGCGQGGTECVASPAGGGAGPRCRGAEVPAGPRHPRESRPGELEARTLRRFVRGEKGQRGASGTAPWADQLGSTELRSLGVPRSCDPQPGSGFAACAAHLPFCKPAPAGQCSVESLMAAAARAPLLPVNPRWWPAWLQLCLLCLYCFSLLLLFQVER